ncbi:MAG: hypothetical protein CLLPBCKN_003277 [Chroococcidiopsis cubana SAG 39.79]|uniref:DUF2834 domain-containing protein n=1 Tax=Chroococcidiopsis cubana SAG 39.79 TaxID=388085 RepID=A0AB37UPZ0_9CYAN|nr:DUF2834 domain-containing protein [Chroococcidiopsis cubana]MDZ4873881.1 hypothetical protein [Chroococcidiopsis cubana SAG 39.79]PSB59343.1 hypothetical protein C7B79_28980 [Chroococcidiopsis cubana CCALA 043]RUT13455.1 hypothetical protein DSM107010_10780 [Chroococcidiopsis cubana SAG 39.79]
MNSLLAFSEILPFLFEQGFNPQIFVQQLFTNKISTLFGWDVIVAELVLWVFILWEGSRLGMKYLWVYFASSLIGISTGLPLFLLMRQRYLIQNSQ